MVNITMAKKINIRPTTAVYATYKNIKYNPWTAIAEFVDNSTQSYYDYNLRLEQTKYWQGLNVEIIYEKTSIMGQRLIIRDNAFGMDFNDFQRAIILDSPPKNLTRSEFGMGLKTAACWFGLNWSVESTTLGSRIKYRASVDIDALHKYKNEEIEVEEEECSLKEHGTTITIWNLHRGISSRQIGKTKDQLRGIYRTDLRKTKIKIYYNGELLSFEDPPVLIEDLPDGTKNEWKQDVNFQVANGNENYNVTGFIALRDTASTSDAGFALLRHGRVIVGGYENNYRPEEVFEKSNSFVYQRLFGELNLDNWPVTQTKDAFDWYNGLEDSFIDKLIEICAEYRKKAKDYRKGKKTTTDTVITSLVQSFTNAGIIENTEVKSIIENTVEPYKPNPIPEKDTVEPYERNLISEGNTNDIIIVGETGKKLIFKCGGTEYTFNVIFEKDDPQKQWLYISRKNTNTNEYDIEWNIRHPFFKPYIDDPTFLSIMEQFIFAFALSEIESYKTNEGGKIEPSTIRMGMNDMLKSIIKEE